MGLKGRNTGFPVSIKGNWVRVKTGRHISHLASAQQPTHGLKVEQPRPFIYINVPLESSFNLSVAKSTVWSKRPVVTKNNPLKEGIQTEHSRTSLELWKTAQRLFLLDCRILIVSCWQIYPFCIAVITNCCRQWSACKLKNTKYFSSTIKYVLNSSGGWKPTCTDHHQWLNDHPPVWCSTHFLCTLLFFLFYKSSLSFCSWDHFIH